MTIDKQKLKALAERAIAGNPPGGDGNPFPALAVRAVDVLALFAEIERLESEAMHTAAGAQSDREQIDQLKAENEALRKALSECIQSLAEEMLQKYQQKPEDMHPSTRRRYDLEMEELAGYRAAMAKEVSHG